MNKYFIIGIIFIFNLTSCNIFHFVNAEDGSFTDNSEPEFFEGIDAPADIVHKWKLMTLRANVGEDFVDIISKDKTPTLKIDKDNRFGGYDGCNTYSGRIIIGNNNILFSKFLSTQRGCHPDVYWHQKFYSALSNVNNYTMQNGNLLLKRDSYVLMVFVKIE